MSRGVTVKGYTGHLDSPVYLSGPMTGWLDHNYPTFNRMAARLRKAGLIVYNPAENFGGAVGLDRSAYMRLDFGHVLQARCIVCLAGWANSSGSQLEVDVAQELDLPIWQYFSETDTYEVIHDGQEL